ncbi:MAG: ubiquinol-cytochrome c reductase iron-sulfur subunit [Acetobacteraceae bacterium]|nr:ubiquinol-cytochrome c reductase iron-sulfur subunit [Acetobacteraceae bacterium]
MADVAAAQTAAQHGQPPIVSKRDFLKLLTGSGAIIGTGALVWPFIDYMNPSKDVLALSSVEVDLTPIPAGQGITVSWRGKPGFVRHRTPEEVKKSQDTRVSDLLDPAPDSARVKPGHAPWVVVIGICTHLGCIPLGNKPTDPRGDYGGWFCPCHGSQYDTAGRVRRGPAPANLELPTYAFESDTKVKIG